MKIRVLCVEDHGLVREGIAILLGLQRDIEVIGAVATGEEAVAMFATARPDVTLMDMQLPGISGLEAIRQIRRNAPESRIIVLTVHQGDEDIHRALEAGASTYLLKDTLSDDLIRVIREVHAGRLSLSDDIEARLAARATRPTLTSREIQVVELIAQGMRNKEISASLGISEETARAHVKHIMAKLRVHDRSAILGVAVHRGIIHLASHSSR